MCSELMQVLSSVLNERERMIVVQSFGIGCPERGLEDIGSEIGLTRERVRQIRMRSIEKVRNSSKSRLLLKHLG
jgi:RNA polymerase primary sigma factor